MEAAQALCLSFSFCCIGIASIYTLLSRKSGAPRIHLHLQQCAICKYQKLGRTWRCRACLKTKWRRFFRVAQVCKTCYHYRWCANPPACHRTTGNTEWCLRPSLQRF